MSDELLKVWELFQTYQNKQPSDILCELSLFHAKGIRVRITEWKRPTGDQFFCIGFKDFADAIIWLAAEIAKE